MIQQEVSVCMCGLTWLNDAMPVEPGASDLETGFSDKCLQSLVIGNFPVMSSAIVLGAQRCFSTKFAQGCRFW